MKRKNNNCTRIQKAVATVFRIATVFSFADLGDVALGSDIADAVWYFAKGARNTTGAELVVDGGNTVQLYPIIE